MARFRFSFMRAPFLIVALAAMLLIFARGADSPAEATTYDPHTTVRVSDPTPGVNADLIISFSVDSPDSFPNITTNPAIQFIPRQWGINTEAPIGTISGTFNVLTSLAIVGVGPCTFPVPVPFTMHVASIDPEDDTEPFDLDLHPGGPGYSGQFAPDLDTVSGIPDFGTALIPMNDNEMHNGESIGFMPSRKDHTIYRDVDGDGFVSWGDIRLTEWLRDPSDPNYRPAGTVVGDPPPPDTGTPLVAFNADEFHNGGAGPFYPGGSEAIYRDVDGSGAINPANGVTWGDIRLTDWHRPGDPDYRPAGSVVGVPAPSDAGTGLVPFNANEFHNGTSAAFSGISSGMGAQAIYLDVDGSGAINPANGVTAGDIRLTPLSFNMPPILDFDYPAGSVVAAGDAELGMYGGYFGWRNFHPMAAAEKHDESVAANGQMDPGEHVYRDADGSGDVSQLDKRLFEFEGQSAGSLVADVDQQRAEDRRFVPMAAVETHAENVAANGQMDPGEHIYLDKDGSGDVSEMDERFFGSVRIVGDVDQMSSLYLQLYHFPPSYKHAETVAANGQFDPGEGLYADLDGSGDVSLFDKRVIVEFQGEPLPGEVFGMFLEAGITHYPTFLKNLLPKAGAPIMRLWGGRNVLDQTAASMNLLMYAPGQLSDYGFPASLGYASVVVALNPFGPLDLSIVGATNELCTPLALTNTSFGVSQDNPNTPDDEGNIPLMTNPQGQKDYLFTLVTQSQPDADDDGIENMLDTCPFDPNTEDTDGRTGTTTVLDPDLSDLDMLDGACDPNPLSPSGLGPEIKVVDEDLDNYGNRADNCPLAPNGITVANPLPGGDIYIQRIGHFYFVIAVNGGFIGPDEQADSDGDSIGDACEGSEHGAQCLNALDDDGDDAVNDGCPRAGDVFAETGDQCLNAADDDHDGFINDGCPSQPRGVQFANESYWACYNARDDDRDGFVNDGCVAQNFIKHSVETGAECENSDDDDGDGVVNDGCPAVDPGDVAKYTVTGDTHEVTREVMVSINKHGVRLDSLGGPKNNKTGGAKTYSVAVSNLSDVVPELIQVALQVADGCATVNGEVDSQDEAVVSVGPGGTGTASFTVDWTGCPPGDYTVEADACHGGDPSPAGFFGSGACPGWPGHGEPMSGVVPLASATASSEQGVYWSADKAIDGQSGTRWEHAAEDQAPGTWIEVATTLPADIDSVDLDPVDGALFWFETGTITMSNGFSQDVTLTDGGGSFSFPTQTGVEWVRFTALTEYVGNYPGMATTGFSEFRLNGSWLQAPPDPNPEDDTYITKIVTVGP